MAVSYGKGDKAKATKLHSKLTRKPGICLNCGSMQNLQCAHIVSRMYSATRTDLDNSFCICSKCHFRFNKWPVEFSDFIMKQIGRRKYNVLVKKATSGAKMDWTKELERLKALDV